MSAARTFLCLFFALAVLGFADFGLTGCAYRFGYAQRDMPGGYKKVAVLVFKNKTKEVGIESFFTDAMIRQFSRSQVAEVVPKSEAPVVVEGNIVSVEYKMNSLINGNDTNGGNNIGLLANTVLATEYRIIVHVDVFLHRLSDQKQIWNGAFIDERVYTAPQVTTANINSVDAIYNQSARMEVIEQLASDMMHDAHDRMTENF